MRWAEERFSASIRQRTSIRWNSTGEQVGCTTKQSAPRTFSRIWQLISPSENFRSFSSPSGIPNSRHTASVRGRLALPVKTLMRSGFIVRTGLVVAIRHLSSEVLGPASTRPGSGYG